MDLQPMTTSYCRHSPSLQRGKRAACFPFGGAFAFFPFFTYATPIDLVAVYFILRLV